MFKNTTVWKPERLYSIRSDNLRKVMWSWLPSVASDHAEKQKKIEKVKSWPWALLSAENLRLTPPNANKNYTSVGNGLFRDYFGTHAPSLDRSGVDFERISAPWQRRDWKFRCSGFPKQGFGIESIAKNNF